MKTIDNWSTCYASDSPFIAPELRRLVLRGVVRGPREESFVSEVTRTEGRVVYLSDGDSVELGTILPDYERWLKDTGQWKNFNHANPIRMVDRLSPEAEAAHRDDAGRTPRMPTLPASR